MRACMSARREARCIAGTTTLNRWVQGPSYQRYHGELFASQARPMKQANSKQILRNTYRTKRQALSPAQQRQAGRALVRILTRHNVFRQHRHIAFYLANDGEIDPAALLLHAHRQGKACYLPVIRPNLSLDFVRYRPGDPLHKNRYGIAEPGRRRGITRVNQLELVLLPLVAFDKQGGRLGMGGGFYDRSFQQQRRIGGPLLIGLAHTLQQVDYLVLEDWDVRLAAIVTEQGIINASDQYHLQGSREERPQGK